MLTLTRSWIALLGVSVTLVAGSLQGAPGSTSTPDYQGIGVIVGMHPPPSSLHATRPVVVLRHEPIVGLMDEAMEHPFIVASTDLFAGLHPGDRVAFGHKSTPDALLGVFMRRLPPQRQR